MEYKCAHYELVNTVTDMGHNQRCSINNILLQNHLSLNMT